MFLTLRRSLVSPAAWTFVLLALTARPAPAAPVPPDAGPSDKLPETAPGRCVTEFLEMMADPTPERITAFETAYRSPKRLKETPMDERISRARGHRERMGKLTLREVVSVADSTISIAADNDRGDSIGLEFEFDAEQGGKLDAIRITLGNGPAGGIKPQKLLGPRRGEIVEAVATAVDENYVYPDTGHKMAELIREKLKAGDYDQLDDDAALTRRLTDDLRSISNDRHLGVRLEAPASDRPAGPSVHEIAGENSAFRKVEVLPGNIGYVRLDAFVDGDEAQETAAALAFVAHCDALIFDLRHNGGGSPESIRFITSYLFDKRAQLNDMVDRSGNVVEEYWTLDSVPGRRFAGKLPVYVLTSSYTFSGAEEFCYNLQNLKRATIVGEKTGGRAHPVRGVKIDDRVVAGVPFMRACNPISKTNWEGVLVGDKRYLAVDGAVEFVRQVRAARCPFRLISNNTTDDRPAIIAKLERAGFDFVPGELHTCTSAAVKTLRRLKTGRCLVLGSVALRRIFLDAGFTVVDDRDVDAVIVGLDTDLTYQRLQLACEAILRHGAAFIALHHNRLYYDDAGRPAPSVGALVTAIEYATQAEAVVIGKPSPAYYQQALDELGVPAADVLVVSDDPFSDLAGAKEMGMHAALVLSGKYSDPAVLATIPASEKPDLVADRIGDLLTRGDVTV